MLEVAYQCDNCDSRAIHRYHHKPAILSRKEHGWAWVRRERPTGGYAQKLLCGNCTKDNDEIVRDGT